MNAHGRMDFRFLNFEFRLRIWRPVVLEEVMSKTSNLVEITRDRSRSLEITRDGSEPGRDSSRSFWLWSASTGVGGLIWLDLVGLGSFRTGS